MAIDNYTPEQIEEILQAFFEVAGTRQYIGARYVPIFGRGRGTPIEWDDSDAYEPLSIVYYQGDTYTSRRYVPAGIAIDNQDYWVITGRYNAQVEQYRQEVLSFQGQIDSIRTDMESDYVPFPDALTLPKYGTLGQVLTTLANGETKWEDPVVPSDAQAEEIITQWLDDHPEATTTVQDNSITNAKLVQTGGILTDVLNLLRQSQITASTYATELADADDADFNSIYRIFISRFATGYTANLPEGFTAHISEKNCYAILFTFANTEGNPYLIQTLVAEDDIYRRYKLQSNGTFTEWTNILGNMSAHVESMGNDIDTLLRQSQITASTYATELADADDADFNSIYRIFISRFATGYTANLPEGFTAQINTKAQRGILITLANITGDPYGIQTLISEDDIYRRYKLQSGGDFSAWVSMLSSVPKVFTASSGRLVSTIETALQFPNSIVYVNAGSYDILDEYQTQHPDDWSTRNQGRGLNLNNGIHLIFASNAYITCHYNGNDQSVLTNFSAFNIRYGSATIENLHIECSRIRYCVHDDMFTSADAYHNRYLNCVMSIDNSQNPYRSEYPHCIGGGFGKNADITIENCVFSGTGGDGSTNPAPTDSAIVSWHNGPNSSQRSRLTLAGCYFRGTGGFRSMSNGTATEKSILLVHDNSFGSAITEGYSSGANTPNMEVLAFNNEIRP